jgi:hypothetical protein
MSIVRGGEQRLTAGTRRLTIAVNFVKQSAECGLNRFDADTHNIVQNVYVREVGGQVTNVMLDTFPLQKDKG